MTDNRVLSDRPKTTLIRWLYSCTFYPIYEDGRLSYLEVVRFEPRRTP